MIPHMTAHTCMSCWGSSRGISCMIRSRLCYVKQGCFFSLRLSLAATSGQHYNVVVNLLTCLDIRAKRGEKKSLFLMKTVSPLCIYYGLTGWTRQDCHFKKFLEICFSLLREKHLSLPIFKWKLFVLSLTLSVPQVKYRWSRNSIRMPNNWAAFIPWMKRRVSSASFLASFLPRWVFQAFSQDSNAHCASSGLLVFATKGYKS